MGPDINKWEKYIPMVLTDNILKIPTGDSHQINGSEIKKNSDTLSVM